MKAWATTALLPARVAVVETADRDAAVIDVLEATEVGADDVVFDSDKANKSEQTDQVTESGQGPSDQELRALWLKRSQTSPAVFLKAKFAAQLSMANSQVAK